MAKHGKERDKWQEREKWEKKEVREEGRWRKKRREKEEREGEGIGVRESNYCPNSREENIRENRSNENVTLNWYQADDGASKDADDIRLTVSLRSIFEAEGQGQGGIVLKELGRERVPPQIVAFLQNKMENSGEHRVEFANKSDIANQTNKSGMKPVQYCISTILPN